MLKWKPVQAGYHETTCGRYFVEQDVGGSWHPHQKDDDEALSFEKMSFREAKQFCAKHAREQAHHWNRGGYLCRDCGAIRDRPGEAKTCDKSGNPGFDVWFYHAGAGWWLAEDGIDIDEAVAKMQCVGTKNVVAGIIIPSGRKDLAFGAN